MEAHLELGVVSSPRPAVGRVLLRRDAIPLLLLHIVIGALIAFGPTYDDTNRIAGLLSVGISLAMCVGVMTVVEHRLALAGGITLAGLAVSAVAFSTIDRSYIADVAKYGWWPIAIASAWPHLDKGTEFALVDALGLTRGAAPRNLVAVLTLAVPISALSLASVSARWLQRIAWLAVAFVGALIVLGCGSRGSTGGLLVGTATVAALTLSGSSRTRFVLPVAFVLGGMLLGIWLSTPDPGLDGRAAEWSFAARSAAAAPITGSFGSYANVHADPGNPHNTLLQTLVDTGVVGVAALLIATLTTLRSAVAALSPKAPGTGRTGDAALARLAIAGIGAYIIAGAVDSVLTFPAHFPALGPNEYVTLLWPVLPLVLAAPLSLARR